MREAHVWAPAWRRSYEFRGGASLRSGMLRGAMPAHFR